MSTELEPVEDGAVEPIAAQSRFTPAEIDSGLLAVAILGSASAAAKHLRATGLKVTARTLRRWRNDYPRRLAALQRSHAPEIERAIIGRARHAALSASIGVQEAIDLERERIRRGEVKDASASAQRLSIAEGIQLDKTLTLQDRPTSVIEHRLTHDELWRKLAAHPAFTVIDSRAEELPDD